VPPGGARHAQADGAGAPAASGAVINRWALLKERNILLCVLISCFFLTWFVVIISFAPVFLVESRHLSPSDMGVVMTCLGAAWAPEMTGRACLCATGTFEMVPRPRRLAAGGEHCGAG
jgi:hypothetical protein